MKRVLSLMLIAALMVCTLAVNAGAASYNPWRPGKEKTVSAEFYILKEGLSVPVGTASEPVKNYDYAGKGRITINRNNENGYYDPDGVDEFIVSAPSVKLKDGQSIIWYVIKDEKGIWHVDGVITPFCSILYDSNCDNAMGATADETHYYKGESAKVKENGFVREGYKFKGWNTASDGTGTAYAAGDVITSDNLVYDKSINIVTLYAQWEAIPVEPVDPKPTDPVPTDPVPTDPEPTDPVPTEPVPTDPEPTDTEPTEPEPTDPDPTEPEEPVGEVVNVRIDAAKRMAVRFEDGSVYYDGDMKDVEVGKEYKFQICSVNWDNGIYDDNGNGLAGSVVYTFKAVHKDEFDALRAEAVKNPDRYTVKGIDIIDNEAKTIIVNCDASDFHLETDVNNFFVAYRFHFANGDYNKQTGIENVVNTPLESLSVNLPVGTTVKCDAYIAYEQIATENIFITGNNGEGEYAEAYLASVNDYTWNY